MSVAGTVDIWTEFVATRRSELRNELITTYVPLVRHIVSRLKIPSSSLLEVDDLISYGILGLMNAIDRFDPSRGVPFEAFAFARIRGSVIDQLRVLNWLPRSAMLRIRRAEFALARLEQRLGRLATEEEAAADLGVSTARYSHILLDASITVMSLDALLPHLAQDDGTVSLVDLLEDYTLVSSAELVERGELLASLETAINQLSARERLLLSLYYQKELTMEEIGTVLGICQSRVSQLHMQAVSHLRRMMRGNSRLLATAMKDFVRA